MARKFELISEMYRDTLHKITLSQGAWRDFLRSACNNYRLPFDDQVLVFAQRPDATAVLEIERWNKQFRRWVNAGATGIAVFDKEYAGRSRLKHYFDISDTHGSSFALPVPVWAVKEDYEPEIIETLQASFGVSDGTMDLENTLLSAPSNVIADNYHDYLEQLMTCTEGSFLEELDELNVKQIYIEALECSVAYMLLERCLGGAADQFAEVVDFASVMNFNTRETVNALGCAVSDISEIILCEVAKTVRNLQINEKKQIRTFAKEPEIGYPVVKEEQPISERSFDYGIELQHEGRIQNPESAPASGAGGTAWEVRVTSPDISEGTAENYLHEPFDLGQAEQSFDGNREAGDKNDAAVDDADGESRGRDGGIESNRPDALGGIDEQHPPVSGGNGAERSDLQLNTENAGGDELPAFLDEKLIFGIIENKDDDLKYKKKQIELFFSLNDNSAERADYLKSAYPDRYSRAG